MKFTARRPQTNVNVTPVSPLKEFFILAGSLLGLVIGVYLILGLAVDLIVPRLSPSLEKKMAKPFLKAFSIDNGPKEMTGFVQDLVDGICNRCTGLPYDFKVHIKKGSAINAAALPGGHIVVFTGLLEKMNSENELVFVLAHELGHYAHRDHLRGVGRAIVLMALSVFLTGPDNGVNDILSQGLNITELRFSRDQELWADLFALDILNCYYGYVTGCTDFFEKIPKENDPGKFGHYFASHPENQRRIDQLNDVLQEKNYVMGKPMPLPGGLFNQ